MATLLTLSALFARAVTLEELKPAVATWYEYAKDMKENKGSSMCVVL